MRILRLSICILLFLPLFCFAQKQAAVPQVVPGVSKQLADFRAGLISDISYDLQFNIPSEKAQPIVATETLTFSLKSKKAPVQIDFKGDASQLKEVKINGGSSLINYSNEHLLIPVKYLRQGNNTIIIDFIAGNAALNRNDDYLYSLLVPDHARTLFPCFDQPNLKAIFKLTLEVPQHWNVIANGLLKDTSVVN